MHRPGDRVNVHGVIRSLAIAGVLLAPHPAAAFCRKSACDGGGAGTRCTPARADDCGVPLRWPEPCLTYSLTEPGPPELAFVHRLMLIERAAVTWSTADCGAGARPGIRIAHRGPVACGAHAYDKHGGNANVIAFTDPRWPDGLGVLARTSLTFDRARGAILDADIIFNWPQLGAGYVGPELASIALHELGHFLGLAHSPEPTAVMNEEVHSGALRSRLAPDDVAAICAAYPPGPATPCEAAGPPRGSHSACAPPVAASGGCAAQHEAGWLAGLLVVASCAPQRRRMHLKGSPYRSRRSRSP